MPKESERFFSSSTGEKRAMGDPETGNRADSILPSLVGFLTYAIFQQKNCLALDTALGSSREPISAPPWETFSKYLPPCDPACATSSARVGFDRMALESS